MFGGGNRVSARNVNHHDPLAARRGHIDIVDPNAGAANDLNLLAESSINELVHPDDQQGLVHHIEELKKAGDGEIKVYKYRVKDKSGHYHWLANHESVFRRNDQGEVIQTIGITLDIDKEERTAVALRENENLHQQAEAITHLGSYTWDMRTNKIKLVA